MLDIKFVRIGVTKKEAQAIGKLLSPSFVLQALSYEFENGSETDFKRAYNGISKKEAVALIDTLAKQFLNVK